MVSPDDRLHGLDFLRGAMMLLGLVLHSALAYCAFVSQDRWGYHDPATSPLLDVVVAFIHVFRMPVFFLMAGFFAALLRSRRGTPGMLANRLRRVGVPFVLAVALVPPLVSAGYVYARTGGDGEALRAAVAHLASGAALRLETLHHLWFLWYLLLYYVTAIVLLALLARLPGALDRRLAKAVHRAASSPWGPVLLAGPTFATLVTMRSGTLETSSWFVPSANVLAAYAVFFAVGWLLHDAAGVRSRPDRTDGVRSFDGFERSAWARLAIGAGLFAAHYAVIVGTWGPAGAAVQLSRMALLALAIWFLVYGITGISLRYLARPVRTFRYLADASYWMYLAHLAIVVWLSGALAGWVAPAPVKFLAVLAGTTVLTLGSYDLAVRRTAVGVLLNGRRAPARGLVDNVRVDLPVP